MQSHGRTEKSQNVPKRHRTKALKDQNQSGQYPQKRKYSNTPRIEVYDPISVHVITWYRCGQSTFSSCDHVGGQRKVKIDKSTIGQQPQRIKIKVDKTPKRENILILQSERQGLPPLFVWAAATKNTAANSRLSEWVFKKKVIMNWISCELNGPTPVSVWIWPVLLIHKPTYL